MGNPFSDRRHRKDRRNLSSQPVAYTLEDVAKQNEWMDEATLKVRQELLQNPPNERRNAARRKPRTDNEFF